MFPSKESRFLLYLSEIRHSEVTDHHDAVEQLIRIIADQLSCTKLEDVQLALVHVRNEARARHKHTLHHKDFF